VDGALPQQQRRHGARQGQGGTGGRRRPRPEHPRARAFLLSAVVVLHVRRLEEAAVASARVLIYYILLFMLRGLDGCNEELVSWLGLALLKK
jgi:hypothetical protein